VSVQLHFYNDKSAADSIFESIEKEKVLPRLKALVSKANRKGLEVLDPDRNRLIRIGMETDGSNRVVKNGYGLFDLSWNAGRTAEWATRIDGELEEIRGAIYRAHGSPLRFLIWAGMGGSAEDKHAYIGAGLLQRGVRCYVLDSTDPAKLKHILEDMLRRSRKSMAVTLQSTLVVGMAMGMTSYEPVLNLEKLATLYEKHEVDAQANFLYMTLPGSLLDRFALARGFRKVELQMDGRVTTAGRHSSPLTRGSLYPLGLSGANLEGWMSSASLSEEDILSAWKLSAFLHAQGLAGRDKVTLMLPKPWEEAGVWTKQDFEESLGKSELVGIKIVIGEKIRMPNYRPPRDSQQDRVFVAVVVKDLEGPDADKVALLRRAGYPVATFSFERGTTLAEYMQFVHYVVFGLAWLRDMNFVTQPGVELYKAVAARVIKSPHSAGPRTAVHAAKWRGGIILDYGHLAAHVANPKATAPAIYGSLVGALATERKVEYGELTFFGDTRYSARGRAMRIVLNKAGETLFRSRLKMPVDIYEGPAMNHSYHEMIIGHGRCFSTILISEASESIPEIAYSADYHRAQYQATLLALAERGRPVVSITVKDLQANTLLSLQEFFREAAKWARP